MPERCNMRRAGNQSRARLEREFRLPVYLASFVALLLSFACVPAGNAQNGSASNGNGNMNGTFSRHSDMGPLATDDYNPIMTERRLRALNMERQKEMVSDTNKLLRLARELNEEVAGQKSEALTLNQLHKVAEIEKLARNVRDRMTSAVGETQSEIPPATIIYPTPH